MYNVEILRLGNGRDKNEGKKLQEIFENKPDTGFVKVQILFFAQRPVCVCICVQIWIFPIFWPEWMDTIRPFHSKVTWTHKHTSDPRENTIQGYFYIIFCHRGPNTFSGHIVSFVGLHHRVYRVPGFLSSRRNWVPHPLTRKGLLLFPPLGPRGETHSLGGDPIQTKGKTLWYSMYTTVYGLHILYISAALKKIHTEENPGTNPALFHHKCLCFLSAYFS